MSDASYPEGLYYNEDHDWARVDGESATFGITHDAVSELIGDELDEFVCNRRVSLHRRKLSFASVLPSMV